MKKSNIEHGFITNSVVYRTNNGSFGSILTQNELFGYIKTNRFYLVLKRGRGGSKSNSLSAGVRNNLGYPAFRTFEVAVLDIPPSVDLSTFKQEFMRPSPGHEVAGFPTPCLRWTHKV